MNVRNVSLGIFVKFHNLVNPIPVRTEGRARHRKARLYVLVLKDCRERSVKTSKTPTSARQNQPWRSESVTLTTNAMEVTTSDAKERTSSDIVTVRTTSTDIRLTASDELRPKAAASFGANKTASGVFTTQLNTPSVMDKTCKDLIQSTATLYECDTTSVSADASTEDDVPAENRLLPGFYTEISGIEHSRRACLVFSCPTTAYWRPRGLIFTWWGCYRLRF